MVTTIILSIILGAALCFSVLYFRGKRMIAAEEKQRQRELLLDGKNSPYQVYVHKNGRLFYEDKGTISLVVGLEDFFSIHPGKKKEDCCFLDQDPETQTILFVGPFNKGRDEVKVS